MHQQMHVEWEEHDDFGTAQRSFTFTVVDSVVKDAPPDLQRLVGQEVGQVKDFFRHQHGVEPLVTDEA